MPECAKCTYEKSCPRLKQSEKLSGDDTTHGDIWKPLKCVKKARQVTRKRSVAEMLLMMFRSSNRELLKQRK